MLYDDNFGEYEVEPGEEEEVEAWYHSNQRESVMTVCVICGRKVKLLPQYDKCNSCCERIERGEDW